MHLLRPHWLTHQEGKESGVCSCHVSPDSSRLATGGLDGTVRIWSTEAILKSSEPSAQSLPRQLCALNNHTGSVSVVRFSGSGQFLASGSDDKVVLVYERDLSAGARPAFGSTEHTEHWRTTKRLVGHDNDVQDLGWSADSSILVSVGLDSKIVIWGGHTFEKLKVIDAHQSHIKGITFDPAGRYFATASDDRTIKIFRWSPPGPNATAQDQLNNFVLENTISKPFEGSPLTTYFRRCSWSPDGSHIAAANATNGPVSSVAIITRGFWDSDINLIGHEGPVEVCAFSPRMFSKEPIVSGKQSNYVTVIACAGQDKAVSIWNTSNPRPLLIAQMLASKVISDLAWAPDGHTLYATSLDGSITAMVFENGDLGYIAPPEENTRVLAKYGYGRTKTTLPDGPTMLRLEEKAKQEEMKEAQDKMGELMGGVPAAAAGNSKEMVTTGANVGSQWQAQSNGDSQPKEDKPAEKEKDPPVLKQKITITKEGKKRVAPLLVSSGASQRSMLPSAQLVQQAAGASSAPSGVVLELSKPYDSLPKGGLQSLISGNKRRQEEIPEEAGEANTRRKRPAISVIQGEATKDTDGETPEFIRPAVVNPALAASQIRLAVPKLRTLLNKKLAAERENNRQNDIEAELTFEAKNPASYTVKEPTKISVSKGAQVVWFDYLPRAVLLATGNEKFWAVACEDGAIHLYSPVGRRLANPLVIEAQSCFLECKGWWLMCITAVGTAHSWNIKTLTAKHPPVSIGPILNLASTFRDDTHLTKGESIAEAGITTSGSIIITLTNGEGYTYSPLLHLWQKLSEPWWVVGSEFFSTQQHSSGSSKPLAGVVSHLERMTATQTIVHGRGAYLQQMLQTVDRKGGNRGFRAQVSVGHLENRIAGALAVGTGEELKTYLLMYARVLGNEGLAQKAEELCRDLMGGMDEDDETEAGNEAEGEEEEAVGGGRWGEGKTICGLHKRDLLKAVILVMGKYRELQRIVVPYAELLGFTDDEQPQPEPEDESRMVIDSNGHENGASGATNGSEDVS